MTVSRFGAARLGAVLFVLAVDGDWSTLDLCDHLRVPLELEAEAKPAMDIVVRTHDYAVAGPRGILTVYEADDPTCAARLVYPGQGYVDTGHGHLVRNESGQRARDVTVISAPVGLPFRGELPAPNPYCGF